MAGRTFDQLIDFTRTTAGTYVDSTGKIVNTPASRNLLTFTQQFDNAAWTKNGTTVTANTGIAPDGTSTADKLVETATTAVHNAGQSITTSATAYTFSCYVKAAERTFAFLYHTQSNASVSVNLTTGATGQPSGTVAPTSSSVTAVGDGWYRIAMTVTATAASNFFGAYVSNSLTGNGSYAGDGTSGVLIWGAQLELGSLTTYTRNVGGVFPPRFDYDPVTRAPRGLLIEEQRVNLLLRSEEFDNASWSKSASTVTANTTTSPDGTADAEKLVEDSSTGTHSVIQSAGTVGVVETLSVFAKQAERQWLALQIGASSFGYFNLAAGTVGTTSGATATITNFGNGWYRCTITATRATTTNNFIYVASADATASYTGNGTSGIFIWGAQLEAGAFATSYIPTVASQVTRAADVAAITGPNFTPWYNQSAGTWVVELQKLSPSSTATYGVEVTGASSNFSMRVRLGTDARLQSVDGGVAVVDAQLAASVPTTVSKYGIAYKLNDYAGSAGGAAAVTDTSATVPALSALSIGSAGVTNIYVRSIRFYPSRLTNAQLQALTA